MTLKEKKIKRLEDIMLHIQLGISKTHMSSYEKAEWLLWFIEHNIQDVEREDLQEAIQRRSEANGGAYTKASH